jgi:Ras-related protein Rab-1A
MDTNNLFKVVLLGDSGVGKTSLLVRYVDNTFTENVNTTMGVDFFFRHVNYDNEIVKLQLWDTAGKECFRVPNYTGCDGIILVYDVCNRESFEHIKDWVNEGRRYSNEHTAFLLIGNKSDRTDIAVSYDEGETLSKELNIPFLEVSSKTGQNVKNVFMTITNILLQNNV